MRIGQRSPVSSTQSPATASAPTPAASAEATKAAGWAPANRAGEVNAAAAKTASPGDVVRSFYDAFEKKDVAAMGALYANDVKFKDAIFAFDDKQGVTGMWKKLFATDPNTKLKFTVDSVQGDIVKGHWVADYHLAGRPVHNEVSTTMRVRDGKIVEHTDDFSWKKWAPQAFPGGKLFTLPGFEQGAKALIRAFLG